MHGHGFKEKFRLQSRAFSNRCVVAASHLRNWVRVASSLCGRIGAGARYTIAQPRNATAKLSISTEVICASRFTASYPVTR
jgi:hypothetical protein